MTLTDNRLNRPPHVANKRPQSRAQRVVVMVDGRPASSDALAWAADEAVFRRIRLRIVTAFADPDGPGKPRTIEEALRCQQRLRHQIEKSRPWLVSVEWIVRSGSLPSLLTEATGRGDVLVVAEACEASSVDASQRLHCAVVTVPARCPISDT